MGATGTTTVNFGSFPGSSDTSVAVTGQTAISSTSLVEAWIWPVATADHTADEHWIESIQVRAGNVVAGTGFTIYAWNTSQINEPVNSIAQQSTASGYVTSSNLGVMKSGSGTLLYGQFTVAWVWN